MRLAPLAGLVLLAGWVQAYDGQGLPASSESAWAQLPLGMTACAGAGVQAGQAAGPGCVLACITDGACATFVRDPALKPVHFHVRWEAWNRSWVEGTDTDGLYCTFIGDMLDGRITVLPDASAGPAGIMNTQEDEGQFCYGP
jgi:hypothetical protein